MLEVVVVLMWLAYVYCAECFLLTFHAHTCLFSCLLSLHCSFLLLLILIAFCFLPSLASIFTSFKSTLFLTMCLWVGVGCTYGCRQSMEGRLAFSLELKLKAFVSFLMWVIVIELCPFWIAFNHSAISLTFSISFFLVSSCLPLSISSLHRPSYIRVTFRILTEKIFVGAWIFFQWIHHKRK